MGMLPKRSGGSTPWGVTARAESDSEELRRSLLAAAGGRRLFALPLDLIGTGGGKASDGLLARWASEGSTRILALEGDITAEAGVK